MGRAPTLASAYRRFAVEAVGTSPLRASVAATLGESSQALAVIETLPPRSRQPALVLAALSDLALAGRAPGLAAAYAAGDGEAAARAAVATVLAMPDAVSSRTVRRRVRTDDPGRCGVLLPAVAEAASRVGAEAVGLVDVGCGAGFNLLLDRVGARYGDGPALGDPSSPLQVSCSVVGHRAVPTAKVPPVVVRVGVDPDPVDVTDEDEARWLRACRWPGRPADAATLEGALALAAADPPVLLRGDVVDVLPDALAHVPAGALPVVTTTWGLSRLPREARLRFLQRLDAAATDRPVAWVSVEGVGVAPAVPTLGDRHASGHSIVGVTVLEASRLRSEAVARCWSRGRILAWLAPS